MKKLLMLGSLLFTANVSANLLAPFETQFDTDFVAVGVGGFRGTGGGDITLTGVLGTINQAYLYWHGPTNSTDPAFNANITVNGTGIAGVNIGVSDNNFWGQTNSQAYRADVTSLVSGNGVFSLAGLSPNNSNGASLVVYFDDGNSSNNNDVVTFDGNDANFPNTFDPDGWNIDLSGINYSGGTASLLMGVSDGQIFADGVFNLNGTDLGVVFNGNTVPNTVGSSVTNGGLWDLVEVDITSFLSIGVNSLTLTHSGTNDALSAIHFQVILPAGSALNNVPTPTVLALLGFGFVGFGLAKKKKVA